MKSELQKVLSDSFNNYMTDRHPKDRRMQQLDIGGMSTENISFMINELVRRFAKGGVYAEVGILRGRSLLSAAYKNLSTTCIGIDNFSEFDSKGLNEGILKKNIAKVGQNNVKYVVGDYRKEIEKVFKNQALINVYFYDGCHKYQDQFDGLEIVIPYLAENAVIIVDDVCWPEVSRANDDFCSKHNEFKSFVKIRPHDGKFPHNESNWWNGFEIIYKS